MGAPEALRMAKEALKGQLLQLGRGGQITTRQPSIFVDDARATAGRNVHAVGIGPKLVHGKETTELAVRLYVVQKLPTSMLAPRELLPRQIHGVPTDVIEAPPAFFLATATTRLKRKRRAKKKPAIAAPACTENRRRRQRPVVGGISAGHWSITAGTISCFCQSTKADDDPSAVYVLSNNHVFANVNSGLIGDPLFQPGSFDGGGYLDHFANLHRFVRIHMGGTIANRVDAAIGIKLPSVACLSEICCIGQIAGTVPAAVGMLVRKHGRTTGYTEGRVDDADYDALVGMDHNNPSIVALFEDQIRIVSTTGQPIGLGGDSGSAVVHRKQPAVTGLYFAGPGSGSYGVANKIDHVLDELEIKIP